MDKFTLILTDGQEFIVKKPNISLGYWNKKRKPVPTLGVDIVGTKKSINVPCSNIKYLLFHNK